MEFDIEWPFETKRIKNRVLAKKIAWIPIYELKNDNVWLYFDYRISKYIYKVIQEFQKRNIEFLLISPVFSNPSEVRDLDFDEENIRNYLTSFTIEDFYFNFERINFNLIDNLVKYTNNRNCFNKIKPIYDDISRLKSSIYYNWGQSTKEKTDIVRNRFQSIWREIMLSNLNIQ